jgi:hypothetical protein
VTGLRLVRGRGTVARLSLPLWKSRLELFLAEVRRLAGTIRRVRNFLATRFDRMAFHRG